MDIINAVSTVGFPAVMCLLLLKKLDTQESRYAKNETQLRKVISENTLAILSLKNEIQKRGENNG